MMSAKFGPFRTNRLDVIAILVDFNRSRRPCWVLLNFIFDPRIVSGVPRRSLD